VRLPTFFVGSLPYLLCPLLTPLRCSLVGYPLNYLISQIPQRPPGVSCNPFVLTCRIYLSFLRMTIGRPDLWVSYPERQASYPISFRHIKILSNASFRFTIARDTLAFDYGIPVIRAPWGLVGFPTHPLGLLHARHTNSPTPMELPPLSRICSKRTQDSLG
jgi:hypothetical protein